MYGAGENVTLYGNTFVKPAGAPEYVPVMLGWYKSPTKNIRFFSNKFKGLEFVVAINDYTTNYSSEYDVGWTLTVKTTPGAEVVVTDKDGKEAFRQKADEKGRAVTRLVQYCAKGKGQVVEAGKRVVKIEKTDVSAYTVKANGKEKSVALTADAEVEL